MKIKGFYRPLILILPFFLFFTHSCGKNDSLEQEKTKPVKIMAVKEEKAETLLKYTGTVIPKGTKKVSFKSPGKINAIYVQKGDYIEKGQLLAELDKTDLEFALKAAQAQLAAAQAQYNKALKGALPSDLDNVKLNVDKAQNAYDFTRITFEKLEKLHEAGGISDSELEQAKLELDIRKAELNQAKKVLDQVKDGARDEDKTALLSQVRAAETDVAHKKNMLEEAELVADMNGYIVEILNETGEMIGAGYPVLVIRNTELAVQIGVSEAVLTSFQLGMKATVGSNGTSVMGEIDHIAQIPDERTRTYLIEISVPENAFPIGSITRVEIAMGEELGIWIPIKTIIANEQDYVFIIKDDLAVKTPITIENIRGSQAKVSGITTDDQLVIEGLAKLKDRDKVAIQ